jgi:iron complex outermembrane recepter protein
VRLLVSLAAALMMFLPARTTEAQEAITSPARLKRLSLEELTQIEITSAARRPEPLSTTPAAASVLTQEEIGRSGFNSIPELLRLVPGVNVARVDAQTWAITARGFNDVFANKLLVMMDGRTLYTPLFSGVFWDVQDTMLEDIDRIEVVRGPGATLWGANAVNGVINIISKHARDTQGLLISGGGGTEERAISSVRYGAKIGDDAYLRVFAKYVNYDSSARPDGSQAFDAWEMWRGGFRADFAPNESSAFTFQGEIYTGDKDRIYGVPTPVFPFAALVRTEEHIAGGNLLGRWTHSFSPDSQLTVQSYYDRTVRETPVFAETRDTGDIDVQHRFSLGERQEIVWGAGFRTTRDDVTNSLNVTLTPPQRTLNLFSAFVQDEITIVPERFGVTLGSKFEHNDFTGFEVQPSIRTWWTPDGAQTLWASVSRAVRTPSRAESDIRINPPPPVPLPPGTLTIVGNPAMRSEEVVAYEIGYRATPAAQLSLDVAAFYNDYEHLRSLEPLVAGPVSPTVAANNLHGETYGFEVAATAQPHERWRVQGSYSHLRIHLHRTRGGRDLPGERATEGSSPRHQLVLRSMLDLPWNVRFDTTLRYVDELPAQAIPSYTALDLRLAWSPRENVEVALVGRDLLDNQHPEFLPTFINTEVTQVERSFFATIRWKF